MTDAEVQASQESNSIEIVWEPEDKTRNALRWLNIVPVAIVAVALYFAVRRALMSAVYPDEAWFLQDTVGFRHHTGGLFIPNFDGYGSLWWSIEDVVTHFFNVRFLFNSDDQYMLTNSSSAYHALFVMRLISVAFVYGALTFALVKARGPIIRCVLAVAVVLPYFWWAGKWAAPDYLAVAAGITAATLFLRKSYGWSLFLMAMCVGLRLTSVFAFLAIGALAFVLLVRSSGLKRGLLVAVAAVVLGYLVANPYILAHPHYALNNAKGVSNTMALTAQMRWHGVTEVVTGTHQEWDGANVGSFAYWFGSSVAIVGAAAMLLVSRRWALLASVVVGAILLSAAVFIRGFGYGWYYTPLVAFAVIAAVGQSIPVNKSRVAWGVAAVVFVGGCLLAVPKSTSQYSFVRDRSTLLTNISSQSACIKTALANTGDIYSAVDPMVVPASLMSDGRVLPAQSLFRLWLEQGTGGLDSSRLTFVTTRDEINRHNWMDAIASRAQTEVNCGPYVVGRPSSTNLS